MNSNLNILITIESFWDGGAEIFAIRLAKGLSLKHNVYFLELYPYRTRIKKQKSQLNNCGVKVFQVGENLFGRLLRKQFKFYTHRISKKLDLLYNKLCIWEIKYILRYYNIDIVNSHSWDTDYYFSQLKNEIDFYLISTFHGHYELLKNYRFGFEKDTNYALSKIDKVVCTTKRHINTLRLYNYPLYNTFKIFYGISIDIEKQVTKFQSGDILKLVMVARGIKEKGWEEAVLAFLKIIERFSKSVELILVGEGPYLDYLKSVYQHQALTYIGYQEEVYEFIKSSHIGLLPSNYSAESLPNTIIEYLICGKPVISTNIGAIKEMLNYNGQVAGYVLELNNGKLDVNDLVEAVENYIKNPVLVEVHSKLAIRAAEKFTMKRCLEDYEKLFYNCMKLDFR